jgi:hypothetical protein
MMKTKAKTRWNAGFLSLLMIISLVLVAASATTYAQGVYNTRYSYGREEAAYKAGYSYGRQDRQAGRRSNVGRYSRQVDRNERREFRQGYQDGYRAAEAASAAGNTG